MPPLQAFARGGLRNYAQSAFYVALALIYAWFGAMKFTDYEAKGLVPLVSNSPLLFWFYDIFSVRGFSFFLGLVEWSIGALILVGLVRPALGMIGGLLSAGLFLTTISFMLSTPGVFEPQAGGFPAISVLPGQFLLKDVGLLTISFWIAVDCLERRYAGVSSWIKPTAAQMRGA